MLQTANINIEQNEPLPSPNCLQQMLPIGDRASELVYRTREAICKILRQEDPRILVVVGPCSIHNVEAALEYARRLAPLARSLEDVAVVIMRTYFEKPRTTLGWKGLIYDPDLDGSDNVAKGLHQARKLLLDIADLGLPCATEFLDPVVPQYIADLISWAAIGARTVESQTHREMSSGLSMPVGFKNSTEGSLQVAVDALITARHPHSFVGIDELGRTAMVRTRGNPNTHIILRGGRDKPNYDEISVEDAIDLLKKAKVPPAIMVDCSHANSRKDPHRQPTVMRSILRQRSAGVSALIGLMIESHLKSGNQPFPAPPSTLKPDLSITDPCLGWDETEAMLCECAERLRTAQC